MYYSTVFRGYCCCTKSGNV